VEAITIGKTFRVSRGDKSMTSRSWRASQSFCDSSAWSIHSFGIGPRGFRAGTGGLSADFGTIFSTRGTTGGHCSTRAEPVTARLCRRGFVPTVIITDKLRSYGAALREIGFSGLHEQGLRANNRAENSHQPLRRRERKMQGFKSTKSAQRFVAVHAAVYNTFSVQPHLISCPTHRQFRTAAHNSWSDATAVAA
jgi:hypothetical protein